MREINAYSTALHVVLFAAMIIVGAFIFRDYGLSWDEGARRGNGIEVVRYVLQGDTTLLGDRDRYNTGVFQLVLVGLEWLGGLTGDSRQVFFMRHLVSHYFFCVGIVLFYCMCRYLLFGKIWSLSGAFMLYLSPRVFAHSFYNSSDIPFLVIFIAGMITCFKFLDTPTIKWALLHAVVSALTINMRYVGCFIPFITIIFIIFRQLGVMRGSKHWMSGPLYNLTMYMFLTLGFVILFSPGLWENPLVQLNKALLYMRDVPWGGKVLYLGDYIQDSDLPWHYIPVWIAISTPLFYVLAFILGAFFFIRNWIRRSAFLGSMRNDLAVTSWFFLPMIGVMIFRPGLYDAWRHMFYVYPAFLIIALSGLKYLWEQLTGKFDGTTLSRAQWIFIVAVCISFMMTGSKMIRLHPYENVYFNRLAGPDMTAIKNRFELDYWGLSYRNALEYILHSDKSDSIPVYVANQPGKENAKILKAHDRKRLEFIDAPEAAKYFISNYRWHKEDYSYAEEYYSVTIDGAKIMVVYKLS